jgi:hypothetical protein
VELNTEVKRAIAGRNGCLCPNNIAHAFNIVDCPETRQKVKELSVLDTCTPLHQACASTVRRYVTVRTVQTIIS